MTEQNKTTTIPLPVQGKDMDSIMQSLESGVEELFTSNRYQEFLKTMAKFHNYSFNNTMLIAMQRPDATLVTKMCIRDRWECSVVCAEKSTPDSYVITYSDAKILSNTGVLTVQNRNDFDITVHLLCEGKMCIRDSAQTERSVAATSTVLVTESVLSSAYQHYYWMFLSRSPIATTDSRTRIDSYLSRAFVNSHSRKLANAQTERSVAATSAALVTESKLGSGYLFCYVTAENLSLIHI